MRPGSGSVAASTGARTGRPPRLSPARPPSGPPAARRRAEASAAPGAASRAGAFLELTKPGIVLYVLLTVAAGFLVAAASADPAATGAGGPAWRAAGDWLSRFLALMAGTALVAGGTNALNQYAERDRDARMHRTRSRPLPSGRLRPRHALAYALGISTVGTGWLAWRVDALTAGLAAATVLLYVLAYTPLKRISPLSAEVGALPGALPIVGGWTAATGEIGAGALALFAILFLWQMPHFLALGWLLRDDYRRGGFRVLAVTDPGGCRTARRGLLYLLLLVPVSHLPLAAGAVSGPIYAWGSLALGAAFLAPGILMARRPSRRAARRVFLGSILYLPALLILLVAAAG